MSKKEDQIKESIKRIETRENALKVIDSWINYFLTKHALEPIENLKDPRLIDEIKAYHIEILEKILEFKTYREQLESQLKRLDGYTGTDTTKGIKFDR